MEFTPALTGQVKALLDYGDVEAHRAMTFAMRYGKLPNKDERIYSRDPEVIKQFWKEKLGVKS